jgi:hypothetical protein
VCVVFKMYSSGARSNNNNQRVTWERMCIFPKQSSKKFGLEERARGC